MNSQLLSCAALVLCLACSEESIPAPTTSAGGSTAASGGGSTGAGASGGGSVACEPLSARVVSEAPGASSFAHVAWNGEGWGIAWSDDRDDAESMPGDTELYFARLDAAGEKIGADVRVTAAPGLTNVGSLVWNGSDYAVVLTDSRTPAGMYFTRLDAGGAKLFDEVWIAPGQIPRLTWNGTDYGLSWTAQGIVQFARLDSTGTMLGTPTIIGNGYNPSPAVTGSGWGIAFHFGVGDFNIHFVQLDARGAMVGAPGPISMLPGWHASLAALGDGFGVAWNSGFAMGMAVAGEIYFARLDARGLLVAEPQPLTAASAGYWFPSLAAGEAGWGLAWVVDTDLEVVHLDAAGAAASPSPLSSTAVESFFDMQLASSGRGYGLAWPDNRDGTAEIWFAATCP